jgi:endonuclease YncB( thermonuclease family)
MTEPNLNRRRPSPFALATAMVLATALALGARPSLAQDGCRTSPAGSGVVAAVRDGRTFLLADGREVRLVGIEPGTDDGQALRLLVAGKLVRLAWLASGKTPEIDRYGRLMAFAAVDGTAESVQQTLLVEGQARVSARIADKTCAEALLSAETAARAAGRGLWANPNSAPLSSNNLAGLEALRGHFALVQGKVLSVRESGATIYVNFGRRWTKDFTVIVLKRQRRAFAAAGIDLNKLEGHRIRVRGFIEQRGGPIIMANSPEQIEAIE